MKLWREYQTFLDHQTLKCQACSEEEQGRALNPDSDQIGWRVPAVPTDLHAALEDFSFWGYTSVPPDGVKWWNDLPNTPVGGET